MLSFENIKKFDEEFNKYWNKIKTRENFSFLRYGDGEGLLMKGKAIHTHTQAATIDGWDHPGGKSLLGCGLMEALNNDDPKLHIGVTSPAQNLEEYKFIRSMIKVPDSNISYADLLVNENYCKFVEALGELDESVILIASENAMRRHSLAPLKVDEYVPIPQQVAKFYENKYEELHKRLDDLIGHNDKLFLISAGPLSEVIIDYLFRRNPNNRYIDVGSATDEIVHGRKTRPYMYTGSYSSTTIWHNADTIGANFTYLSPAETEATRNFFSNNVSRDIKIKDDSHGELIFQALSTISYGGNPIADSDRTVRVNKLEKENMDKIHDLTSDPSLSYFIVPSSSHDIHNNGYRSISHDSFSVVTNILEYPLVTFVIPTTGRGTIGATLGSIRGQDPNRFIPAIMIPDLTRERSLKDGNNAGLIRNAALDVIHDGWVGFVDDDDTISDGILNKVIPWMTDYDVIIPRAMTPGGAVIWAYPEIAGGNVGIWFYYNKTKFPDVRFMAGGYEDLKFLKALQGLGARIKFLDEIGYYIRPHTKIN